MMAIKVNGTTVIDNNRNIDNIGTLKGLTYPSADGTAGQFLKTDGSGNLAFQTVQTDPTLGTLTKSFTSGETASITLAQAISPAPVVSVTKEVAQAGVSSKGAWDVNATASNYELHNTAYDTTLTPSTVLDLTSATYDNNSRSTGGSYGPRFSSDGLKLFVNDQGANNIRQYNLSTAWLLPSSATHTTFSTASQVNDESGFCFSDNGLHFYLCDQNGSGSNTLHQYSITSGYPYDLVGYGSFTRTANMTSLGEAAPATRQISSVLVEDSGTKMYIFSGSGSSALIRQYTLSTAYDISSATYANKSFDIYADYGSGGYLGNSSLSSDGKQLLVANGADDIVMHYTLGTAWDISTASRIGTYDPAEDANVSGVHLKPDNSKFFMLGGSNQTFYRYTLGSVNALTLGTGSFASTDVGKRIQGNGGDVTLTSTAGAYDTTGGSAFTDSSTIASGSWTMRGLKSAGDADGIGLTGYASTVTSSTSNTGDISANADGGVQGFEFSSDGTKLFAVDNDDEIFTWNLSTAYDLSTLSYVTSLSTSPEQAPRGIHISDDGTNLYVIGILHGGNFTYRMYHWTLSTPYNLGTANYQGNTYQHGVTQPGGMHVSSDGTKWFIGSTGNRAIYGFVMGTAFSMSTANYLGGNDLSLASFSLGSTQGPKDFSFNSTGTKLWVLHADGVVSLFNLSTAWDLTSATFDGATNRDMGSEIYLDVNDDFLYGTTTAGIINEYSQGSVVAPTSQYHIGVTNSNGQIDSQFWTDINSMTADQAAGDGTVHYAVSTDDRTTWSVAKASDGVRPIVRDNSGTWQYNSDATYGSTTWTNATTNDEFYALQEALGATSVNRMDKTQLDAVADGSHFTLGDTLDLAIALRQDTASASTPKSDGVSINYDAAALNQGAVLGTDYDYDFPDSTTVRVTSNAAQNLKVRVV